MNKITSLLITFAFSFTYFLWIYGLTMSNKKDKKI